jgi:hypothetical protein
VGQLAHTDGIQIGSPGNNLVVRHNWIDPSPGDVLRAPIIMYTGSGTPNPNDAITGAGVAPDNGSGGGWSN